MVPWLIAASASIGLAVAVVLLMGPLQSLVEWSDNQTVGKVLAAQGIDHGAACHLVRRGSVAAWLAGRDRKRLLQVSGDTQVSVDALNNTRDMLLKAAGGFVLLLGALGTVGTLYYTASTARDSQKQARAAQDQVLITRDQALTDRYTRAVDQTASSTLDARVGGIYALERIMKDSHHDQPTIVQVLAAFVRAHAQPRDENSQPPADVQAAITVLARRDPQHDDPDQRIDLHDAFLNNAEFDGGSFRRADLSGASLGGTEFTSALLTDAELGSTDLSGSILKDVQADGAIIDGETDLTGANLTGASLRRANLRRASFDYESVLTGTDLTDADLRGADLRGVDLRKVRGLTPQQVAAARQDGQTKLP